MNQRTVGEQTEPAVVVSPDGRALIVWNSAATHDAPPRVCARLFDREGRPMGDEFFVSTASGRRETIPSAAFLSDAGFAVAFAVCDAENNPAGIVMQRFDTSGRRVGSETMVSGSRKISQIEPVITAVKNGYPVAWLDAESDGSDYGVLARRIDGSGHLLGDAFVVNTVRRGPQNAPAIAVALDGRFAIAWNSADGDGSGVFAQLFDADGSRIGHQFRINRHISGEQRMRIAAGTRRLAFGPSGELVCVWSGDGGKGDKFGVNITVLRPKPLASRKRVRGVTPDMIAAAKAAAGAGTRIDTAAKPHEPPTFNSKHIDQGEREISMLTGDDIGFTGILNTGWTPPDPHLAVGPEHVVVMTNGAIGFFLKDGTQTFQDEIEDSFGFWGSVGATGFVFDPEVIYDPISGRFFAMAAEAFAPGDRSFVLIAVSDDSDPNGNWHRYRLETTSLAGNLFDSPNIGVDNDAVYVTGDGFGLGENYPIFIFDKASMLVGDPPAVTRSLTLNTSTQSAGIPPVSFDDPPALYMIEHQEGSSRTRVRLIALTDPLGSPSISSMNITVPTYSAPGDPPQRGTSVRPETFDARFWSAAYRDGSLWATHHVNLNPVRARWYEIRMNDWPVSGQMPELVQSGEIDPGAGVHTYFTSITAAPNGSAALCFARSATDEFISMSTAIRLLSDPLGTFREAVMQKQSSAGYSISRWGDYSAINVDPSNNRRLWAHHEFATNSRNWQTWIAGFWPQFAPGDVNCDGAINSFDIEAFLAALFDPDGYDALYPGCDINLADTNQDGAVDAFDIVSFVELLFP